MNIVWFGFLLVAIAATAFNCIKDGKMKKVEFASSRGFTLDLYTKFLLLKILLKIGIFSILNILF